MGGFVSERLFSARSQACLPSSCGMFVYSELTSKVRRIQPRGRKPKLYSSSRKSFVSRMVFV